MKRASGKIAVLIPLLVVTLAAVSQVVAAEKPVRPIGAVVEAGAMESFIIAQVRYRLLFVGEDR